MSVSDDVPADSLLEVKKLFEKDSYRLTIDQEVKVTTYRDLLKVEAAEPSLAKSTRSLRRVAMRRIKEIHDIGPEAFLLCALVIPFTKLAHTSASFPRDLQVWLEKEPYPPGLTATAKLVCKFHGVADLAKTLDPLCKWRSQAVSRPHQASSLPGPGS